MPNRPYQQLALNNISNEVDKGVFGQLIVMATGTGKTQVFSQLPNALPGLSGKMLVLAHREELIEQAIAKLRKENPTKIVQKEKAQDHADPNVADIIVASVASLGGDNPRILKYNWELFDKFVTDEAHHSVANNYMRIYEKAGLFQPGRKALHLGVTATPSRADGKGLNKVYQKITFNYSMRQAIEEGWLVDVRGYKVDTQTSLDAVKIKNGNFDQKALALAVNSPARNRIVLKAYQEYGEGRRALGFAADIKHAQDLAAEFVAHQINAAAVWGDDPERENKLAMHRAGAIEVLFCADLLVEGYDDWRIGCIILGAPTKSGVKFAQEVGRGTRLEQLWEDETIPNLLDWTGRPIKRDLIVLDIVDHTSRHSLTTLPTLMGLASGLNLQGGSLLGAVNAIEDVQKEYPHLDLTGLVNIDDLEAFVEKINLFEVHLPEEVETNSTLMWHLSATGGYLLLLPRASKDDKTVDEVHIQQNLLDKFEITAKIEGKKYRGERATIEEAFTAADNLVMDIAPDVVKLVDREAAWNKDLVTEKQLTALRRLYPGKQIPPDLSKGAASGLLTAARIRNPNAFWKGRRKRKT